MIEQKERRRLETQERKTNKPLGSLVDLDTLIFAGFKYQGYAFSVPKPDGKAYIVHLPDPDSRLAELAIVEDPKQRGAVKWREWYVGRVDGIIVDKSPEERKKEIESLVNPANWVNPSDLQKRIEEEIDRSYGGAE